MAQQLTVSVGMGELRASKDRAAVLVAYGLGSCVGVCIYDPVAKVGGLAHVMLPASSEAPSQRQITKFADRAVPMLMEEVLALGGGLRRMVGKIAGGAHMLIAPGFANCFNVGERNVEAVKAALVQCGVPLLRSETGGNRGRTLEMHPGCGRIVVRVVGEPEVEL